MLSRRTGRQHAGGLFTTHHADARVGPHPQEARRIGATAHAVVAGAKAAADDHRELGHLRAGDGRDHLGAVARDAFVLVLAADHEARDVLQEHSGILRWQQSSMKCAPLSADSENSTPLLATMPTGMP